MQQSPIKDKDFGFIVNHETKFADIRHRALKEYIYRKTKHKKDKTILIPETTPGKIVVVSSCDRKETNYYLFEVVDFCPNWRDSFKYFGILLKTTDKNSLDRIRRIDVFNGTGGWGIFSNKKLIKISQEDIVWIEEKCTNF